MRRPWTPNHSRRRLGFTEKLLLEMSGSGGTLSVSAAARSASTKRRPATSDGHGLALVPSRRARSLRVTNGHVARLELPCKKELLGGFAGEKLEDVCSCWACQQEKVPAMVPSLAESVQGDEHVVDLRSRDEDAGSGHEGSASGRCEQQGPNFMSHVCSTSAETPDVRQDNLEDNAEESAPGNQEDTLDEDRTDAVASNGGSEGNRRIAHADEVPLSTQVRQDSESQSEGEQNPDSEDEMEEDGTNFSKAEEEEEEMPRLPFGRGSTRAGQVLPGEALMKERPSHRRLEHCLTSYHYGRPLPRAKSPELRSEIMDKKDSAVDLSINGRERPDETLVDEIPGIPDSSSEDLAQSMWAALFGPDSSGDGTTRDPSWEQLGERDEERQTGCVPGEGKLEEGVEWYCWEKKENRGEVLVQEEEEVEEEDEGGEERDVVQMGWPLMAFGAEVPGAPTDGLLMRPRRRISCGVSLRSATQLSADLEGGSETGAPARGRRWGESEAEEGAKVVEKDVRSMRRIQTVGAGQVQDQARRREGGRERQHKPWWTPFMGTQWRWEEYFSEDEGDWERKSCGIKGGQKEGEEEEERANRRASRRNKGSRTGSEARVGGRPHSTRAAQALDSAAIVQAWRSWGALEEGIDLEEEGNGTLGVLMVRQGGTELTEGALLFPTDELEVLPYVDSESSLGMHEGAGSVASQQQGESHQEDCLQLGLAAMRHTKVPSGYTWDESSAQSQVLLELGLQDVGGRCDSELGSIWEKGEEGCGPREVKDEGGGVNVEGQASEEEAASSAVDPSLEEKGMGQGTASGAIEGGVLPKDAEKELEKRVALLTSEVQLLELAFYSGKPLCSNVLSHGPMDSPEALEELADLEVTHQEFFPSSSGVLGSVASSEGTDEQWHDALSHVPSPASIVSLTASADISTRSPTNSADISTGSPTAVGDISTLSLTHSVDISIESPPAMGDVSTGGSPTLSADTTESLFDALSHVPSADISEGSSHSLSTGMHSISMVLDLGAPEEGELHVARSVSSSEGRRGRQQGWGWKGGLRAGKAEDVDADWVKGESKKRRKRVCFSGILPGAKEDGDGFGIASRSHPVGLPQQSTKLHNSLQLQAPRPLVPKSFTFSTEVLTVSYGPFSDAASTPPYVLEGRLRKLADMQEELEALLSAWASQGAMVPYSSPFGVAPSSYDTGFHSPNSAFLSTVLTTVLRQTRKGTGAPPHRAGWPSMMRLWMGLSMGSKKRNVVPKTLSAVGEVVTAVALPSWAQHKTLMPVQGGSSRRPLWELTEGKGGSENHGYPLGFPGSLESIQEGELEECRSYGMEAEGTEFQEKPQQQTLPWVQPLKSWNEATGVTTRDPFTLPSFLASQHPPESKPLQRVLVLPCDQEDTITAEYCGHTVCTFAPGVEEYAEPTGNEEFDGHVDRIIAAISEFHRSGYGHFT